MGWFIDKKGKMGFTTKTGWLEAESGATLKDSTPIEVEFQLKQLKPGEVFIGDTKIVGTPKGMIDTATGMPCQEIVVRVGKMPPYTLFRANNTEYLKRTGGCYKCSTGEYVRLPDNVKGVLLTAKLDLKPGDWFQNEHGLGVKTENSWLDLGAKTLTGKRVHVTFRPRQLLPGEIRGTLAGTPQGTVDLMTGKLTDTYCKPEPGDCFRFDDCVYLCGQFGCYNLTTGDRIDRVLVSYRLVEPVVAETRWSVIDGWLTLDGFGVRPMAGINRSVIVEIINNHLKPGQVKGPYAGTPKGTINLETGDFLPRRRPQSGDVYWNNGVCVRDAAGVCRSIDGEPQADPGTCPILELKVCKF